VNANVEDKKKVVEELKEKFGKAKSIVFVDYKGSSVCQDTVLRANFRTDKTDYKVYKNKMIVRALNELGLTGCDEKLEGTTSVAINYDSEVLPAKVLSKAITENSNLKMKFGVVNGKIVGADYLDALSQIPSREELIAKLLGLMKSPIQQLAVAINEIGKKM